MKFGYTIIYVTNVAASLGFFRKKFYIKMRFQHEFSYEELGTANFPDGYVAADSSIQPNGIEIALTTDSADQAYEHAVTNGVVSIKEPIVKPWGQTVSYGRWPDGTLVKLFSPITV
jgi:lactoylglutathione lyase